MFEDMTDIFYKVIDLARERRLDYERKHPDELEIINAKQFLEEVIEPGSDLRESLKIKGPLVEYCRTLSFEQIKILQCVMYLGRDRQYNKTDSPRDIYMARRKYFDRRGWENKDIEMFQMIEKLPLDEYLEAGLKILQIDR